MFYSSTILSRKGSLGTVWIAAHLQSRLKKSHYTSFRITETVEEIMCPPVPIALRMSSHLLLGIARIYSKKVEFLFEDCNLVLSSLIKAFGSTEINLPVTARHAPIDSITLPETFNLDEYDLEDGIYCDRSPDNHLSSREEITLPDHVPVEQEPYIAITFDEDFPVDTSQQEVFPDLDVIPMEEDDNAVSPNSIGGNMHVQDHDLSNHRQVTIPPERFLGVKHSGPTNQTEAFGMHADNNLGFDAPGQSIDMEVSNGRNSDTCSDLNVLDIEVLRNAINNTSSEELNVVFRDYGDDKAEEHSRVLKEHSAEKTNSSLLEDNILDSEGSSLPFQLQSETPNFVASDAAPDSTTRHESLRHVPYEFAIRSTPPIQQPNLCERKRKNQFFDEHTVLSNKFLKKTLKSCKDILRLKRNKPHDPLGEWKLHNLLKKDGIFLEPMTIGLSADLHNAFRKDFVASRQHLVGEAAPEPSISRSSPLEGFQEHVPVSSPPLTIEVSAELHNMENYAHEERTSPGFIEVLSSTPATETLAKTVVTDSCELDTVTSSRAQVSEPPASTPQASMEIEHLRCNQDPCSSNMLSEFIPSGRDTITPMSDDNLRSASESQLGTTATDFIPSGRDTITPMSDDNLRSVSESKLGTTGTGMQSTPDFASSTETCGSVLKTPTICSEEQWGAGSLGHAGIPEVNSAETEDLDFLETDNSRPSGSQGSPEVGIFSPRTRSVAKYLKRHSPTKSSGDISLKKILKGKARKLCARMFYETLVLKSHGLVDIQQDETYGDIALRLTPQLSKFKI